MFREQFRPIVGLLKRAFLMEQRLTIDELLQLAETILDYGLTVQAAEKWSCPPPPYVIVDISELTLRFRKSPQAIIDTLVLLRAMGRAEPLDCRGHWKLKLSDIPSTVKPDDRAA